METKTKTIEPATDTELAFLREYVDSHGFWCTSNPRQEELANMLCRSGELRCCTSLQGWTTHPDDRKPVCPSDASMFFVPAVIKNIHGMPHSMWRCLVERIPC